SIASTHSRVSTGSTSWCFDTGSPCGTAAVRVLNASVKDPQAPSMCVEWGELHHCGKAPAAARHELQAHAQEIRRLVAWQTWRHGACSDVGRNGVPSRCAHNIGARMIRTIAAVLAAFALVSLGARAEEAAKPAADASKAEAKDSKAEKKTEKKADKPAEKTEKAAEKPAAEKK